MRDYLSWHFAYFREYFNWRTTQLRSSLRLLRLQAGDWYCYTFHGGQNLCACGREWQGECCVSRCWKDGLEQFIGGYDL